MFAVALHMGLELAGQGLWTCIRGRCTHRSHKIIGDGAAVLAVALITVRILG